MTPIGRGVNAITPGKSLAMFIALALVLAAAPLHAQTTSTSALPTIRVVSDAAGSRVQVDGKDFMIFGMNWGYMPIGQNYLYSLWTQPDDIIKDALAREMPMLQAMGVNVIRQYVGIPPRWVKYIYERYGIFTVINHPVARYGFTIDGTWIPNVDYADPRLREAVKAEIVDLVDEFHGTPGVLMWLLGNENNYGLSWTSYEAEAIPEDERDAARARYLYSLFSEITGEIKAIDPRTPVAISNGDVQYIDVVAEECTNIDVFGANVYRGISARDFFQVVKDKLGIPAMFTEFGADAWNAREMREDQVTQARYLIGQWREIYEQSSGKGRAGNAIGGFIFQWSDGWWKFGQEDRLDIHDTNASWPNAGYPEDYVEGENNMNEEWWGICAKGPPDYRGLYKVYPRAAYYALQRAFQLDPYAPTTDLNTIRSHFAAIQPMAFALQAGGSNASLFADSQRRVRVSGLRMELETYNTGGSRITTPPADRPQEALPSFLGFDHLQSFYVDVEALPADNIVGKLSLNILGHVPLNPIDEIFYENRGRTQTLVNENGTIVRLEGIERVKVYQASVSWDDRWFQLDGFYRTGHTHWGYEGDFFGLYREAYYGESIDIYNAEAPVGVEISGKKWFDGFKLALGPELYWGANPAVFLKYRRAFGRLQATAIYQDEFAEQSTVTSSIAVPIPPTRRATLHLESGLGPFTLELGGIWAGSTKKGDTFQVAEETGDGGYRILEDSVRTADTFGVRAKLTLESGRFHWYAQAARAGIVADSGPTYIQNFTGWHLKDSGLGNGTNFISGLAVNLGNWQIGPNFLWQKPVVGPVPSDVPPPGLPRNVLDDPFAVRANREAVAAEIILSYDSEPATWLWQWDNDIREGAPLAGAVGFIFRHFPTTMDASIGILEDGTPFPFEGGGTPPRDLWEVWARVVSRIGTKGRLVAHLFAGEGEPNGDDPRLIQRFGGDARVTWGPVAFDTHAKFDDWGPYDYHRDFNLTFPVQLMGDISYSLGAPRWFGFPQTRFGVRGTWRSLDPYSPRLDCPVVLPDESCDPTVPVENGDEWEIRTYMHFAL